MAFAVAIKLYGVVITKSPGPIPAAISAACNAVVPLQVHTAYLHDRYAAKLFSNLVTYSPLAI